MAIENKLSDKLLKSLVGKRQDKQKTIADGRGLSVRVSMVGDQLCFLLSSWWQGILRYGLHLVAILTCLLQRPGACVISAVNGWLKIWTPQANKTCCRKTMQPVTVRDALFYWYDNHATTARKEHEYLIKRFEKHIFPISVIWL